MHFFRASPFGLVLMYLKKRDCHCTYLPIASIGGQSLEPATNDVVMHLSVLLWIVAPESSKIQKPTIDLEQESEKSASEIRKIKREQAEKQKMPKYTIKSIDKAALKE
ncbi:hypothetical protein Tco_0309036 [Tanacetum coccineum]